MNRGLTRVLRTPGLLFLVLLLLIILSRLAHGAVLPDPAGIPFIHSTGHWDAVPTNAPDHEFKKLLISRDGTKLWIASGGGLVEYDGLKESPASFDQNTANALLIINSMVEVDDGTLLIGTIDDSIWLLRSGALTLLYDGKTRDEWSFAITSRGQLLATDSFGRAPQQALDAVKKAVGRPVELIRTNGASFLVSVEGGVISANYDGLIVFYPFDRNAPEAPINLGLTPGSFLRGISLEAGKLAVATGDGCFTVEYQSHRVEKIWPGRCDALFLQQDGTVWISADGLYRKERIGWAKWFGGQDPRGRARAFARDTNQNIWVGTADGLWRYVDAARQITMEAASIVATDDGGVIVGETDGTASRVSSDLRTEKIDGIPADQTKPHTYYQGAQVTRDLSGAVWILNGSGLFKISGSTPTRIAAYPSGLAIVSLAVLDDKTVFAGAIWSNKLLKLQNGNWSSVADLSTATSGSVPAVIATGDGTIWAAGINSIARIHGDTKNEFGPFEQSPFAKLHLFGAIAEYPGGVVASAGWGGTAFVRSDGGGQFQTTTRPAGANQPYLIRSMAVHPTLGLVACSDSGIVVWKGSPENGEWVPLKAINAVVDGLASHIAVTKTGKLWLAAPQSIALIDFPASLPTVKLTRRPEGDVISSRDVSYTVASPGLGLPTDRIIEMKSLPSGETREHTPGSVTPLTDLSDGKSYEIAATASDWFGSSGPAATDTFRVRLPFYQSPLKLSGTFVVGVALLILVITRRGPTGFILTRLASKRWHLASAKPALELSIQPAGDNVVFELLPSEGITTMSLVVERSRKVISTVNPTSLNSLFDDLTDDNAREVADRISRALARLESRLFLDVLPTEVTDALSKVRGGQLQLSLRDEFINLPWEIAGDGDGRSIGTRFGCARSVTSGRLATRPSLAISKLKLVIFAPSGTREFRPLERARPEIDAISRVTKSWGADVSVLPADSKKQVVLEAMRTCNIFHYAGHAKFDEKSPDATFLPICEDAISAADISQTLGAKNNSLLLAFVNGCSSSREADWRRGQAVFGLASAFLGNATMFVGAQWPVADGPAAALAEEFYRNTFPSTNVLLWRWLRRRRLSGAPIAEALRLARVSVARKQNARSTFQAYVLYGPATSILTLD